MKLNVTKTLVDTGTWAASSDVQITLPNEGAITRIVVHFYLTVTGCLAADTNTEFPAWKALQSLRIEGGGGRNYLGAVGEQMGRLLHFANRLDFPGVQLYRGMETNTIYGTIIIHPGSRPRDMYGRDNPFDLTAFIPARDESPNGLKLIWSTTQAADICDTAIDISAGTMQVTVFEVLDTPSMAGYMPLSSTQTYPHTGNISDPGHQFDVPTGSFLRRIYILQQDATAISSGGPLVAGDEIGKVLLELSKDNRRLIEEDWDALISSPGIPRPAAQTAAGAVTKPNDRAVNGFACLDLRKYGHPDYGFDLRSYQTGDVKLGLTIENYTSGDDSIVFFDMVQPYAGR